MTNPKSKYYQIQNKSKIPNPKLIFGIFPPIIQYEAGSRFCGRKLGFFAIIIGESAKYCGGIW